MALGGFISFAKITLTKTNCPISDADERTQFLKDLTLIMQHKVRGFPANGDFLLFWLKVCH